MRSTLLFSVSFCWVLKCWASVCWVLLCCRFQFRVLLHWTPLYWVVFLWETLCRMSLSCVSLWRGLFLRSEYHYAECFSTECRFPDCSGAIKIAQQVSDRRKLRQLKFPKGEKVKTKHLHQISAATSALAPLRLNTSMQLAASKFFTNWVKCWGGGFIFLNIKKYILGKYEKLADIFVEFAWFKIHYFWSDHFWEIQQGLIDIYVGKQQS